MLLIRISDMHLKLYILTLSVHYVISYWDINKHNIENPKNDDRDCDAYCRKMPSYINWREGLRNDFNERRGIDRVIKETTYGAVEGISVPGIHDVSSFVSMFLGIPYAKPPVGEDMFKPAQPIPVGWEGTYDASYYRPACPQIEDLIQDDIPGFEYTNEDCLYLNVFQPNRTNQEDVLKKYPVLVFIHGGGFKKGSAIQYPGIILAQRDMVVVTFNYRLGPLGFLSLGDSRLPGNMGLSDQEMALKWVKENIWRFNGIPEEITLVGHEAGAASVGIHMLSPITKNYFNRAIMMSGSDLSSWAVITNNTHPVQYAIKLSQIVGCGSEPGDAMIRCLRTRHVVDLVGAAENVPINEWETAGPFVPVVDKYPGYVGFLSSSPKKLRQNPNNIKSADVLAGFAKDDGAWVLSKNFSHLFENVKVGVSLEEYRHVLHNITVRRSARDKEQVQQAIEFLYTWWVNPDNSTARRKMLIDIFTDELYASGVDSALKSHVRAAQDNGRNVFMYKFDYRSEKDNPDTYWMGSYYNYDVQYLFGWPYIAQNTTYQQLSSIHLQNNYNELDRNVSNGTMRMWKDFAVYGNPTQYNLNPTMPWNFRNLTWYPMNISNLTYFELNSNSTNQKEYHQSQLAFWQDYIYDILHIEPYTTTPLVVTAYPYEQYQIATYSLSALLLVVLIVLCALIIAISRSRHYTSIRANRRPYY